MLEGGARVRAAEGVFGLLSYFSVMRARLRWRATERTWSMEASKEVLTQSRSQRMAAPP